MFLNLTNEPFLNSEVIHLNINEIELKAIIIYIRKHIFVLVLINSLILDIQSKTHIRKWCLLGTLICIKLLKGVRVRANKNSSAR